MARSQTRTTHRLDPLHAGVAYTSRYIVADSDRAAVRMALEWSEENHWIIRPRSILVMGRQGRYFSDVVARVDLKDKPVSEPRKRTQSCLLHGIQEPCSGAMGATHPGATGCVSQGPHCPECGRILRLHR